MRPVDETLLEIVDVLSEQGWDEVEVVHKTGRSRSHRFRPGGFVSSLRREEGWAVRSANLRRSFFYAAAGSPDPEAPWPEGDGLGFRLPSSRPVPPWKEPAELDAPLVGETEAQALFESLDRELDTELPGARLVQGHLDDGSSEQQLASSRDIHCVVRQRAAMLWIEARLDARRGEPGRSAGAGLELMARDARRFGPRELARRLADRLMVAQRGVAPPRDRGEFLLAPDVVVALLEALAPLWLGPEAPRKVAPFIDRTGHVASRAISLVDDGRLAGAVTEAPVDGEGQPTREIMLIDQGVYRQPLLSWRQLPELVEGHGIRRAEAKASGCSRRASWRDLPGPGPTHLYLRSDQTVGVGTLLQDLARGYYLLTTWGAVRFDPTSGRFAAPVTGFSIEGGRATHSVRAAWLVGSVSSLLTGVVAVARDLTFLPRGQGLIGAPSALVKGLELRGAP
ncbi:MAG: metallopeptidase TldD-related protein [Thermoanaerobaculia bacterium]|nr:metallopeptidase TldD-related protein [Thermoanaerobaculia bacterium]